MEYSEVAVQQHKELQGLGLLPLKRNSNITYNWLGTKPEPETIYINTNMGRLSVAQLAQSVIVETANSIQFVYDWNRWGNLIALNYEMATNQDFITTKPHLQIFPLADIDAMRQEILKSGWQSVS